VNAGVRNAYWAERQAFLYGFKLEAVDVSDAVKNILKLRADVGWWQKKMQYKDVLGVTEIPAGMDIRRFDDSRGKRYLVVDNPTGRAGAAVRVRHKRIAIPASTLSIVAVDPESRD
jgi:hypothetical protein